MANENRGVTEEQRQQRHESRTNQTFRQFVNDLCATGQFNDEAEAVRGAAIVLTRLEQRLTGEEASDLNAQLPLRMVEILEEAKRPSQGKPVFKFSRDDFIRTVAGDLGTDEEKAESIIRAVFATVRSLISEGEAGDVLSQLPLDMRPLWARPV